MKRRLLILTIVLVLLIGIMSVPTIFAEEENGNTSISINSVKTATAESDLSNISGLKSISMFVGESADIKTDILVSRYIVIEDPSSIKAKYYVDDSIGVATTSKAYDIPDTYIRRETTTITPSKVGRFQLVVEYTLGRNKYFDSLDINVVEKNIDSMELSANVTTIRTNSVVDFNLLINKSNTLSVSEPITYTINGVTLDTLKGYKVADNITKLDIVIRSGGKEYKSSLPVVKATALTNIALRNDSKSYGFLKSDKFGYIELYVTSGSFPNISILTKSATLVETTKAEKSDRDGYDLYKLKLSLDKMASNEHMLIRADDKSVVSNINIIDNIYSMAIVPESTKFESGKESIFHVVINGVKDVDTSVIWNINGNVVSKNNSNVLAYKSISNNEIIITATVGDSVAEYKYTIDTSTSSVILTVIVSLVVIIICIPILIGLKKKKEPDLKVIIMKNNKNTIQRLTKLKEAFQDDAAKISVKAMLKISMAITRDEKRAQQVSFECENKAFGSALAQLNEANALMNDLLATYKTNPKDVSINIIDNIVFSLDSANTTIENVRESMGEID